MIGTRDSPHTRPASARNPRRQACLVLLVPCLFRPPHSSCRYVCYHTVGITYKGLPSLGRVVRVSRRDRRVLWSGRRHDADTAPSQWYRRLARRAESISRKSRAYIGIRDKLRLIQQENPDIAYIYTFDRIDAKTAAFVVGTHSGEPAAIGEASP